MAQKKKKQSVKKTSDKRAAAPLLLPAPSLLHSGLRIGSLALWLRFRRFATPTHLALLAGATYLVLSSAFTASFFMPRTVAFSFSRPNCFTSPTLLPNTIAKDQGGTFVATPQPAISIAGYPLYSQTTCVAPSQAPNEKQIDAIALKPLGGPFKKTIRVQTANFPGVNYQKPLAKPLSTLQPIQFSLHTPDQIFEYRLAANNDKSVDCVKTDQTVSCDIRKLGLDQSAGYTFTLQRTFAGQAQHDVFSQAVTTVGAVLVAGSSITPGQTVFDVPKEITLTLNKPAKSFQGAELLTVNGDAREKIPATVAIAGQSLTFTLGKPLARNTSFELKVQAIVAEDGGHLPSPWSLSFTTSGGPKVKGVSIGSAKVSTNANVVLTFDAPVSTNQNLGSFIRLEINGASVPATITGNGNRVTINPIDVLPKCTSFAVRVLDGLENDFGISGGSAWRYNAKTLCHSTFSIGTSVKNRSIIGYRFGSGSSYVVFVGGTHGNEKSSVHTLNSWIDYLERNAEQIPTHRSVIVIPNLNPDGYAASSRTNANNVDLNRNFPASNWKQGVTLPGGSFNPNGGGSEPLSEPESKALANYILGLNPRLVLTYHAAAGVVIPNDSGDSVSLAHTYDEKSNLGFESNSQTGTIFAYDTTGAFEDWLHDKHGLPTLLIELWTMSGNELSKNQNAMWHMVQLP